MATNSDVKAFHGTLAAATEDIVKLTQFWDAIEVENKDAATGMYARLDGGAATVAGAGCEYIGPSKSKVFTGGIIRGGGIPGNTTTPPHWVSIISAGTNAYGVMGIAGDS